MEEKMFNELLESVKQAGAIMRGEMKPGRVTVFEEPDVKKIRADLKLSQNKFASLLGISPATLKNWEQGHRHPRGAARVLLQIAAKYPEVVSEVTDHSEIKRKVVNQ